MQLKCVASLDHSDLCREVYNWNFGGKDETRLSQKAIRIERIKSEHMDEAHVWMMSPPCQPHTRQHTNQDRELDDPRSASFLHVCSLLEQMANLPKIILLENVVGFENSRSFERFQTVLLKRSYRIGKFVLQPHQVGIPNDRPRFYAVGILETCLDSVNPLSQKYFNNQLHTNLPELDVRDRDPCTLPLIAEFLRESATDSSEMLKVPKSVLGRSSGWCFDIVTPNSQRSACFTSGYGSYVKGTGSILYAEADAEIALDNPEERKFDSSWMKGMDPDRFRYFSGDEMARLMGFDDQFAFPPHVTLRQQWKLLGNSLNVRVASRLVRLALRVSSNVLEADKLQRDSRQMMSKRNFTARYKLDAQA
jgi:tRNA (cytosine38-C5)-methyltransferase